MATKVDKRKCTECAKCISVCPQGAISIVNEIAIINNNNCIECGICTQACPHYAIYTKINIDMRFSQNQNGMFSLPMFNSGIGIRKCE
jgi:Fe-S-cluster-containing hydrogenase component 2